MICHHRHRLLKAHLVRLLGLRMCEPHRLGEFPVIFPGEHWAGPEGMARILQLQDGSVLQEDDPQLPEQIQKPPGGQIVPVVPLALPLPAARPSPPPAIESRRTWGRDCRTR